MSGVVSRTRRGLAWGLAAGVVLLMAGDHAMTATAANSGTDPFEILDLQIRPNAIIVLDSSGSMREEATGTYSLSGDDPNSKLATAKRVLKNVVANNKDKISFQFGEYEHTDPASDPYSPRIGLRDRFLYATDDATINDWEVNRTGNGAAQGGLTRNKNNENATVGTKTYYYIKTGQLFNGETIDITNCTDSAPDNNCTGTAPTVTAAATQGAIPPAGLWTDETGASLVTTKRPYVILKKGTTEVTLYFAGAVWSNGSGPCRGYKSLVPLAACTAAGSTQVSNINPYLAPEVFYNSTTGSIVGYADSSLGNSPTSQPAITNAGVPVGLRAESFTPIAGSLKDIKVDFWTSGANYWTNKILPQTAGRRQRTFVIFVTDGDDTCNTNNNPATFDNSNGDARAKDAARAAEALYQPVVAGAAGVNTDGTLKTTTEPASSVTTFLISFGSGADLTRANWIAWGGSGLGQGWSGINWGTSTNAQLQTARNACVTCEDALTASTASELEAALQAAIDKGTSIGEFSSQSQGSVTDSVFEFVALAGAFDPLSPLTRYSSSYPVTVRSTFKMPGFEGQLKAYNSSGTVLWDAGAKLKTNVLDVVGVGPWSFAELYGSTEPTAPNFIPATTAKIRRRIFTTSGNGVNPPIRSLWPPTTTDTGVAPSNTTTYPAGSLDGLKPAGTGAAQFPGWGLGIGDLTFDELKTQYLACDSTMTTATPPAPINLHADCTSATKKLGRARKEAREIILAYTAGAKLLISNSKPVRNATTKDLQYTARSWLLSESTIATPAFVGQPGELPSTLHQTEWFLYRDGPRDTGLHLLSPGTAIEDGFGLRNPDRDDSTALTTGVQEPVMTVLYVAANDMLHAFRGGPQACTGAAACPTTGNEGGGEELWGFVPFDLLPKLTDKRRPQSRVDSTFMLSSSLRFGDVFEAGTHTIASVTYAGKWRTMMFVGRGPGGKYMTGLDITGPGPFTRKALETKLPTVKWNRGNPDTDDGLPTGPDNITTNGGTDDGDVDRTAYATMGETWSVPALVPVTPSSATFSKEWLLWMGSGFSDVSTEGRNFYTINAFTGDVLRTMDVGSAASPPRTNFLSASVVGFIPAKLATLNTTSSINAADGPSTAAFVGDLHGRLFRVSVTDLTTATQLKDYGTDQPIGVAVAALDLDDGGVKKPHIYGVTGADNRIFDPKGVPLVATPPFKMFGLRDDGAGITELFTPPGPIDFPERFRGSTQPLVGVGTSSAVVFFVGTQFNPAGTSLTSTEPCVSSFDSILFALDSLSGNAAYDLNATGDDRSAIWRGQKVQNITARNKRIVLDTGLNAGTAPPPPPPPTPQGNSAVPSVFTNFIRYGSPVCKW